MKTLTATLLAASLCSSTALAQTPAPTNIIYLIGDGMGPAYTSAFRYFSDNPATPELDKTIFDQLLTGMASTYPDDDTWVTDSAASATALASGTKSYNGAIGVDPQQHPLPSLLEIAKQQGYQTAMVVTSQINHATPASFLAHNKSRRNYNEIADEYLTNLIKGQPVADLMLGGGQQYFIRQDKDLVSELKQHGYQYVDNLDNLAQLTRLPALGLFGDKGMEPALGSRQPLRLSQMTEHALRLLSQSPERFVLVVEASQIDWCGHSNDISCAMAEMTDFAATLELVKAYIDQHPNTLMVATADHSTGGLSLGRQGVYQWGAKQVKAVTDMPADIAASLQARPKAMTSILAEQMGLTLNPQQQQQLRAVIDDKEQLEQALKRRIDEASHTGWTTTGHDAVDVQIFSYGQGSALFNGHLDNTEIAKALLGLL
ncbi:alkaline phosphatase [Shewanella sp. NIFS-20-20]|uniref:alkaline phosphatase n=1 Tax=Shewanella sp. NIFS-20-20 TaxID=2853806 RepID=UPI001C48F97D|nr:alkaline phosphatase [Shewanella sp. NIFS-20-20]MBV7314265.1 alkaline phosphatase [Shewanella sp. NIFS-20-20]